MNTSTFSIMILIMFSFTTVAVSSEKAHEIIKTILESDSKKDTAVKEYSEEKEQRDREKTENEEGRLEDTKKEKVEKPTASSPDMMLLKTGIQLFNSSLPEAALNKFNELRTKYPQSSLRDIATIWSGKINLRLNRTDNAVKEFNSISEDSGEYPSALYHLGEAELIMDSKTKAIEYFYKLSSQYPEYELADKALINLTKIYLSEGKGDQSLESAVKIIKYYSDRDTIDDAYYFIGKIFEKDPHLKDIEIARKIYRIFLDKAKDDRNKHFWNSPLKGRVKSDLKYIEETYFKMEN
jgi:outer membrane protein assembly factor BamD (BamD/ComL family)